MSNEEIKELRSLILSERGEKKGPFSSALRNRLDEFLKSKWHEGQSLKTLAEQLGLSGHTVQYWRSRWGEPKKSGSQLRRVEVIAERRSAPRKAVTMHGPAGTRIEGLSLDDAAELWRRLS